MIKETITYRCLACQSTDLIKNGHAKNGHAKNGHAKNGKQQYICKSCGRRGVVNPEPRHTEAEKAQILAAVSSGPA